MSLITRDFLGNNHHSSKQTNFPHDLKSEKDHLQDLNKPASNLLDDTNLDLKLVPLSTVSSPPYTLGKVKFALEREEKEHAKKRSSSTSKSFKETNVDDEAYAAGCPSCLLYVLISSSNPRCPRCDIVVPSPRKKPRIDLNMAI